MINKFHLYFQVQMSIPVGKCCMSDYVRKINHELAIFPQLRNLLRQFTNFPSGNQVFV